MKIHKKGPILNDKIGRLARRSKEGETAYADWLNLAYPLDTSTRLSALDGSDFDGLFALLGYGSLKFLINLLDQSQNFTSEKFHITLQKFLTTALLTLIF